MCGVFCVNLTADNGVLGKRTELDVEAFCDWIWEMKFLHEGGVESPSVKCIGFNTGSSLDPRSAGQKGGY